MTGQAEAKFRPVDLFSRAERFRLISAIIETFPDLAHGDGLLGLLQAVKELAAGQPCAGPSVDESRAVIRAIADGCKNDNVQVAPAEDPKRNIVDNVNEVEKKPAKAGRIRRVNLKLAGVGL